MLFLRLNGFDVSNCCILEKECNLILWKLQMLPAEQKLMKYAGKLSPSYIGGSTQRALRETLS